MPRTDSKTPKVKKPRAWELDVLRGISILMVVWDHTMIDIAYVFQYLWATSDSTALQKAAAFASDYMYMPLRQGGWVAFVFLFFFISGICTTFSRNNFVRGLKLGAVALAVTGATYLLEIIGIPDVFIKFGVLHCLASCILIYALLSLFGTLLQKGFEALSHKKIERLGAYLTSALCLAVFAVGLYFHFKYNSNITEVNFDFMHYDSPIAWLFVYQADFVTADYFPLLPFLPFFVLGAAIAPFVYPKKKSLLPKLDGKWHYPFSIPGRYSLWIYLALQVVMYVLLGGVTWAVTGVFPF